MHRPLTAAARAFVSRSHIKTTLGEHPCLQGVVVAVNNNHYRQQSDDGNGSKNVEDLQHVLLLLQVLKE
jgi:hypothetical protein